MNKKAEHTKGIILRQLGHLLGDPTLSAPSSREVWLYRVILVCLTNMARSYQKWKI